MYRNTIVPRADWQNKSRQIGFTYFSDPSDGMYWREYAYYEFTSQEVDSIYDATKELFKLCMQAVDYVIKNNLFDRFDINDNLAAEIVKSWDRDDPTLYGRFDFTIGKDGNYKMLEFNADTPTVLFEASIVQWAWKDDVFGKTVDQYNSIHETMIDQLKYIKTRLPSDYGTMYFATIEDSKEDLTTTYYIKSLADEAGLNTKFISINDIGYDDGRFLDLEGQRIEHMFKLYPWEWLTEEEYSLYAFTSMKTWIEPVWKMLLSNKAILPVLWEMFPKHPNLLAAYTEEKYDTGMLKYFVKKPILSREGNNVTLNHEFGTEQTDGNYQEEKMIYQETCVLPSFLDADGHTGLYACIGAWIVGDEPCGMGIREDTSPITCNSSQFVPHIFK